MVTAKDEVLPTNGDHHYHVAILSVNKKTGETRHVCGGAIIDHRHVLTTARCVFNSRSDDVTISAGGNGALDHRVAVIAYPKDYQGDSRYHGFDIAVLKVMLALLCLNCVELEILQRHVLY